MILTCMRRGEWLAHHQTGHTVRRATMLGAEEGELVIGGNFRCTEMVERWSGGVAGTAHPGNHFLKMPFAT